MSGVIFSLRNGEVWASWPGLPDTVRLGEVGEVSAMMRDFLQQVELGERLNRRADSSE